MQLLLKKINFNSTPFHPGDSYSPFEVVTAHPLSSDKISITNAASCSQIANESPDAKPNSSWLSSTSYTSTPSPSSYNKSASTSKIHTTQHQS